MSPTFLNPRPAQQWLTRLRPFTQAHRHDHSLRYLSSSTPRTRAAGLDAPSSTPLPPPPPQRWISDIRARVGKCLIFGCNKDQVGQAAGIMRALATEWRELLVGSEGYLTSGRGGLDGRQVAWGEQDAFGHVNNVNYFRYAESARVNWVTNFAVHVDPENREQWLELMTPKSTGLIMRSIKADFKFPLVYPDKISVYHKLRTPPVAEEPNKANAEPPSSFTLDCIVLSHIHRRVACRLEEDIVVYDYQKGGKTAMPDFMVRVLGDVWKAQETETRRARARIEELIGQVRRLEQETWDREGAVEDMGTAKK